MEKSFETILLSIDNRVATLTLNRPDRLNSFTEQMHGEIRQALAVIESARIAGTVRVLVIAAVGRGFCAGQDLSDSAVAPGSEEIDLGAAVERNYKPLVLTLRNLPLPVIAAVNGVAAGAGANLALACDIVIAGRSASFIQPFCKLGLIPDTGGTWILPRLLGNARAMGLALLGDKVSAEQAAQWGMIWQMVEDDALAATVGKIAAQLADGPTYGYAQTKKALWESDQRDLGAQLDVERDLMSACGRTKDYHEGVAAFLEKRPPRFVGK